MSSPLRPRPGWEMAVDAFAEEEVEKDEAGIDSCSKK
jgi:hypothetical protein